MRQWNKQPQYYLKKQNKDEKDIKIFTTKRYKINNIEVPEDIAKLIDDSIQGADYAKNSEKIEKWLKDNINLEDHQVEGTDMLFYE